MTPQPAKTMPAEFKPNYAAKCCNCGHNHTVQVWVGDKMEYDTELCGACTWGESECLDPENW